jgi:hypothetical protein
MAFTTSIFMKLAKVETILGVPMVLNFVQLGYNFHCTDFTTTQTPQEYCAEIIYTKFYPHQATDVKIGQNLIFAVK